MKNVSRRKLFGLFTVLLSSTAATQNKKSFLVGENGPELIEGPKIEIVNFRDDVKIYEESLHDALRITLKQLRRT